MNRGEIIRLSKTVRLSTVQNGEKILDLGAHDCRLRNSLPKCDYIGIDIAPKVVGDTGFYVRELTPEETAKQIGKATDSDLGKKARERIINNFSIEKREEDLLKIFTKLMVR